MKAIGFSLIELMVVIAIVAILAVVAVPAYSSYINQTKISSVYQMLGGFKPKIIDYYLRTNSWAALANDILPGSSSGNTQYPDNAKLVNIYLSSINFASATYGACPSGSLSVSQVLAYLDAAKFSSGYITSTSMVQLLHGTTRDGIIVSAMVKYINGVAIEYIGFGKPATITGSGSTDFMAAVCATYS